MTTQARFLLIPALSACIFLLAACGPKRPVLYPNATLERNGDAEAQRDIDGCIELARQAGYERNVAADTAKKGAAGAVAGGAVGAAVGAVDGKVGRHAGRGAAGGAAAGVVSGVFSSRNPDPFEGAYVNRCLAERGYQVLGWK